MTTYYSAINSTWDEIKAMVQLVTWLSGRVYKSGAWKTTYGEQFPNVIVKLSKDKDELQLVNQGIYYLHPEFDIVYQQKANENPELEKVLLVSGVGAIIDQIQTYTTHCPYWERVESIDVDYEWYSPGMNPKFVDEAKIHLKVKRGWAG